MLPVLRSFCAVITRSSLADSHQLPPPLTYTFEADTNGSHMQTLYVLKVYKMNSININRSITYNYRCPLKQRRACILKGEGFEETYGKWKVLRRLS